MKVVECTTVDRYLKKINDLNYDIEVAKTYKVYSTGVCLLLAGLNISHITQLNNPEFMDIVRQAALSISFAYSSFYAHNVFKTDKRNHEKLSRYENLYFDAIKDENSLRNRKMSDSVLIEEEYNNSGRIR